MMRLRSVFTRMNMAVSEPISLSAVGLLSEEQQFVHLADECVSINHTQIHIHV